jgi:hypothetical protein
VADVNILVEVAVCAVDVAVAVVVVVVIVGAWPPLFYLVELDNTIYCPNLLLLYLHSWSFF